jgi:DNA-binding MarR family transcriptional regulator
MTDRVTDLVLEIFRIHGALIATGDDLVSNLQLTSARWQVLGAIALAQSPLPIAQIARNMGLTRQAVQRVANELESEGFLRFAPNPDHQRAKLVLLTAKGEAAYAAAMKRWQPKAKSLASGLSARSIGQSLSVLRQMRARLSEG